MSDARDADVSARIVRNAPIVILVLDLEGRIEHVNPFFERLTGYRVDEVRGRSWFDVFLPERDRERIRAVFAGCRAGDHVRDHVNPIVTRTGEERQIAWTDDLLRDDQGVTTGILAIGRDVTDELAAERARSVLAAMHDGVVVQSASGEIVDCNAAAERALGLSADQMRGRTSVDPSWRCIHEDGTPFPGDTHPAMVTLRTGVPCTDVVMGVHRPDGAVAWISVNAEPLRSPGDGAVVGAVTSFADITARRHAEAALHAKEAWFRGIFENVNTAIAATDTTGAVTDFNDAFVAMLGYGADELRAMKFSDFTHRDDLTKELVCFNAVLAGERTHYRVVKRYLRKGGREIWVDLSVAAIHDAAGELTNFVAVIDDITERLAAEEAARRSLELLHTVLGATPVVVFAIDGQGLFTLSEGRGLAKLGVAPGEVVGKSVVELYGYLPGFREAFGRARAGEQSRLTVTFGGAIFETIFVPSRDARGEIDGVVGVALDVTARLAAEAAAREGEAHFSAGFQGSPIAMGLRRISDDVIVEANRAFDDLMGVAPGELVGKKLGDLHLYADEAQRESILEHTTRREPVRNVEVRLRTPTQGVRDVLLTVSYLNLRGEDLAHATLVDVTNHRLADAALRDRDARLALVFHQTSDGMLLLSVEPDGQLRVAAANSEYVRTVRRTTAKNVDEADLIGLTFEELDRDILEGTSDARSQIQALFRRTIETRSPVSFERTRVLARESMYIEVVVVPVLDNAGACIQLLTVVRDITARKRADERIRAALEEKETLLREIHHRVKNNLQVVAALLHFQAKKLRSAEEVASLGELRQRIFAMALLHERLYQSSDVARIAFGDYVRGLVAEQLRSYSSAPHVRIDVVSDDVQLPMEVAMPCGLIVNELVNNVLKYAFPGAATGTAIVTIRGDGRGVVLTVDDDGVGLPAGFDTATGGSFGWELVRALVRQLDGSVEVTGGPGAHVRVSFSMSAS